jgi:hypothetical protein
MRATRGSVMTTHDPQAQPPARSDAGSIEPDAIAHRAYELVQERGVSLGASSTIGCAPNTD